MERERNIDRLPLTRSPPGPALMKARGLRSTGEPAWPPDTSAAPLVPGAGAHRGGEAWPGSLAAPSGQKQDCPVQRGSRDHVCVLEGATNLCPEPTPFPGPHPAGQPAPDSLGNTSVSASRGGQAEACDFHVTDRVTFPLDSQPRRARDGPWVPSLHPLPPASSRFDKTHTQEEQEQFCGADRRAGPGRPDSERASERESPVTGDGAAAAASFPCAVSIASNERPSSCG